MRRLLIAVAKKFFPLTIEIYNIDTTVRVPEVYHHKM